MSYSSTTGLNTNNSALNPKRYIDLNSTYRNKKLYPNPCDFTVDINAQTRDQPQTALDPIILAFPYEANVTSGLSTLTQIALSVASSNIRNFYKGSYLEIAGNFQLITFYDNVTQIATVSPGFAVAYPATTPYTIRKQIPFERSTTGGASLTANTIVLNATASSIDGYYNNFYVFLPGVLPPASYQYQRIVSYNGATRTATLDLPFLTPTPAGVVYEIQIFSRDNVVPLRWLGNMTTSNPFAHTLRLTNLVIPNRYVKNGYGGVIQDYPYLYVIIQSANAKTSTNAIFSNNPNSLQAVFKVPITYNFTAANQQFLTLNFTQMEQTISFRENDSLRFTVALPDGNALQFESFNPDSFFQEYVGRFPIECDPREQVSVTFEVAKAPEK